MHFSEVKSMEGIFLDGTCPRCGCYCGNGGHSMTLQCPCGWTGGLAQEDQKALVEFVHRHLERNRKEEAYAD